MESSLRMVDLFCGAGGLSCGFRQAGIPVVAGIDLDENCRFAFQENIEAPFLAKDVGEIGKRTLRGLLSGADIRILAGCSPCQPFSNYTQGRKEKDEKWGLLYSFGKAVEDVRPEIVTMENVPEVARHKVFRDFVQTLHDSGYFVSHGVVYCPAYGIPQHRRRLVLLASRLGEINLLPGKRKEENFATVRETIGHLPPIQAGGIDSVDPLHRSANLSPLNLRRIRASRPGGTWDDWSSRLVAPCHRKEEGDGYRAVYGRMEWDKPSPTITTQCYGFGSGRFGHPEQDRAISLREAALLQTFPKDYRFVEAEAPIYLTTIGRMIGNAVPVELGRQVARSILKHLDHVN